MIPYALYNSKISFEPFQYKPFFEFFENVDKNLYIADEVGVGKTIETGIIISELIYGDKKNKWIKESLNDIENPKILIIAPTSLCAQWKTELEEKFMMFACNCYADKSGFNGNSSIVIYGQSWQQLQILENMDTQYDLLIVDEAHNFRNEFVEDIFSGEKKDSRKYRSLEKIATRAKRKILLSATPIFNEEMDLINESRLLDDNFTMTSSIKTVAKCLNFQPRIESVLVDLSDEDNELYRAIDQLEGINNLTKSAVYLHEGCSSMPCLAATLTSSADNYIKTLFQDSDIEKELLGKVVRFLKEKRINEIETLSYYNFGVSTILAVYKFKKMLESYGNVYLKKRKDDKDSKLMALNQIVNEKLTSTNGYSMKKKHIVVFAHYIATCNYVYEYLKKNKRKYKLFIATGENTKEEIDQSIEEFNQTCISEVEDSVIICSDVCREGKNMQHCQVLINYDLPFSPSIMQQRIGRIDRNGQKHTPMIFNLICNVENDIHTYYEIIFEKVKIINGQTGICNIDVLKETNEVVRESVIQKWKEEAEKKYRNSSNADGLTSIQKAYRAYLRKNSFIDNVLKEKLEMAENMSDREILDTMKQILFLTPNEEIRRIREAEHIKGKNEIGEKLFSKPVTMLRDCMRKDIARKLEKYINIGVLQYNSEMDTYLLDLGDAYTDFYDCICQKQYFRFFRALENNEIGALYDYYSEADIIFPTAIYQEIGEMNTGMTIAELEKEMDLSYDEMFIPLNPLIDVLERISNRREL